LTDPKLRGVFEVWEGGLGIWGGILFGVLAGAWVIKRAGGSVLRALDVVAPALLLAQAIGRLGNWWNQELFGKPTDRPWGLEIDPENRPTRPIHLPCLTGSSPIAASLLRDGDLHMAAMPSWSCGNDRCRSGVQGAQGWPGAA
jgi:prolipoprotein diacylglyceryltransferase